MAHMRDEKNIEIKGSSQKRKLRNMGYFHGYKGYRYCNSPDNKLPYDNFNQIQAVYDFDMKLKTIFYSRIMFVETAIKNYSLEVIIDEAILECKNIEQACGGIGFYNSLIIQHQI